MDIQQVIDKAKNGSLSEDEWKLFIEEMDKEMLVLKEKRPDKYLELLQNMNEVFTELNTSLKS